MEKKKNNSTIFFVVILIVGLSLLLYPSVSNYWNSFHATKAISGYSDQVLALDDEDYTKMIKDAKAYNRQLAENFGSRKLNKAETKVYNSLLDVSGTGIMGYVEIPNIKCVLPIYHGTDEANLQIAIGHLEWSSLPVGGKNTHCVISGHRGLPSAKLFSDLDQLVEGDIFALHVLDETLAYEVDKIAIVEPEDTSSLTLKKDKDLCTLVTCTPYGINTHRLLVTGHRVDASTALRGLSVASDAVVIDPLLVAPVVAAPILLALLIKVLLPKKRRRK